MNSTTLNFESPNPRSTRPHALRAALIVAAAALLLAPGLCAQTLTLAPPVKETPKPVRQKFVPAPPDPARGNGANFTALHHVAEDDPDVLMLMAHAGVGDSFPVQEEGQPKAFDVKSHGG